MTNFTAMMVPTRQKLLADFPTGIKFRTIIFLSTIDLFFLLATKAEVFYGFRAILARTEMTLLGAFVNATIQWFPANFLAEKFVFLVALECLA
jgi:hypothetical protein